MRRESPDELTRLVVTALAVFIGGTAALVANDTIRAYRLEIAAKQAVIELNKELARQDKAAAQAEATKRKTIRHKIIKYKTINQKTK